MADYYIPIETVAARLLLAAGLAFIMGIDRELKSKPYGLRPFMMLSLGSAAFTIMVLEMAYHSKTVADNIVMDPGKVMAGIIAGIGFLGAAAIIRSEQHIIGSTTGTSIWVVGAVGVACGLGYYWHAVLLTVLAVIVLVVLGRLHECIQKRRQAK